MAARNASSSTTPALASMAMSTTKNICSRISIRWPRSVIRKRLANIVVDSHTHHTAENTITTQPMRASSCRCATAELNTRMAATNTRS